MKKGKLHSKQLEECIAELYLDSLSKSEINEAKNNLSGFLETLLEICEENNIEIENDLINDSKITYRQ